MGRLTMHALISPADDRCWLRMRCTADGDGKKSVAAKLTSDPTLVTKMQRAGWQKQPQAGLDLRAATRARRRRWATCQRPLCGVDRGWHFTSCART
jgi:hypothetical protein